MGLTAYEMLCGWRFDGDYITRSLHSVILKQRHWQLPFPRDLDVTKGFEVINKMLAWEAEERITAQEALQHEIFRSLHISNEQTGPLARCERRSVLDTGIE